MSNILGIFDLMEEEKVVLVDLQDQQVGTMGKMEAHKKAVLHRAFSIFILNSKENYSFNNALLENTTLRAFGPTLAAAISVRVRRIFRPVTVD